MSPSSQKKRILPLYWRGLRLLSRYIPHLFTAITLHSILAAVTPFVTLWLFARILETLDGVNTPASVWMWVGIAVGVQGGLMLVGGVLGRWKEALWERLYRRVDRLLTDSLLSMDHTTVRAPHTQTLLARVKEDMTALGAGLVRIPEIYQRFVLGVSGLIAALALSYRLFAGDMSETAGVFSAFDSPLWPSLLLLIWSGITYGVWRLSTYTRRTASALTADVVTHDRTYYAFYEGIFDPDRAAAVRLYRQDATALHYLTAVEQAFFGKNGIKHQKSRGRIGVLQALCAAMPILWLGIACTFVALKAYSGAFGIGIAIQLIGALTWLSNGAMHVLWSIDHLRSNASYLETVYAFLDIPQAMYAGSLTTEKRTDGAYEIVFDRVSFRYPDRKDYALKEVSFTIRGGDTLAVVGENGSGKSTLVKLLCRLYDPDEGTIYLNGIDIRKYRYDEYIALIAAAFQHSDVFAASAMQNIAGAFDGDTARAAACLEAAGFLDDFAQILESGKAPSPNDAQRIAVVRALYMDRPFLVLDEPIAAMDPAARATFYANLDRFTVSRAVILVDHRLDACRLCDTILVLEHGAVVQRGTHAQLMAEKTGPYYALWQAQARLYT